MLDRLHRHASYANIVASVALFLALGGVSYAALRLPANSVGTAQIKNRAVTLSKVAPGAQRALRGQTGAIGPQGPQGSQGRQGPQGLTLFARVDETGALHQHSPGVLASKSSILAGAYYVDFPQDVSGCAPVISPAQTSNNGSIPDAQFLAVPDGDFASSGVKPNQVDVSATDASGNPISAPFDLILAC